MSHSHDQSNYSITSGSPHPGFIKDEHPPSPPYQYQFGDYNNNNNIKQMMHSPATNSPSGYDSPGSAYGGASLPQIPHSQLPSSHYYYVNTPQTSTPVSATSVSAPTSAHTFHREQEALPPQNLDFMNLAPGQVQAPGQNSGLDGNSHGHGNGADGAQMLPPTSNQPSTVTFGGLAVPPSVGVGAPAIELGFGMGIDLQQQHDWSEGLGYDLFDGYFFGATATHPNFQGWWLSSVGFYIYPFFNTYTWRYTPTHIVLFNVGKYSIVWLFFSSVLLETFLLSFCSFLDGVYMYQRTRGLMMIMIMMLLVLFFLSRHPLACLFLLSPFLSRVSFPYQKQNPNCTLMMGSGIMGWLAGLVLVLVHNILGCGLYQGFWFFLAEHWKQNIFSI
jgi:hypothetical protein